MRLDELEQVAREAAARWVARERTQHEPPPVAVVLPLAEATRVVALPDFPDDDAGRFRLLSEFAEDEMRTRNAPCYAFLAEGRDDTGADVLVVAYGARGHHPRITAAPLDPTGVGAWQEPEALDPRALPFLAPLQHAADASQPPDVMRP